MAFVPTAAVSFVVVRPTRTKPGHNHPNIGPSSSSLVLLWLVQGSNNECNNNEETTKPTNDKNNGKDPTTTPTATIPSGRVANIDEWVQWSVDSFGKAAARSSQDPSTTTTTTTLLGDQGIMEGVTRVDQIHGNARYAVLSHGTQDDPLYCYLNQAALALFQFPEPDVYQLPSRYSAPAGKLRQIRQAQISGRNNDNNNDDNNDDGRRRPFPDWTCIPTAIRQNAAGDLLVLHNVYYWTVWNDQGHVVGQTAMFDTTTTTTTTRAVSVDEVEQLLVQQEQQQQQQQQNDK